MTGAVGAPHTMALLGLAMMTVDLFGGYRIGGHSGGGEIPLSV